MIRSKRGVLNQTTIESMKTTITTLLLILFLGMPFLMQDAVAQFPEWPVPEAEAAVQNPVAKSPKAINNGRAFYQMQCAACHGPRGLGDGAIASGSLVSEVFQSQTDGSIFWKLQQGRGQMPSFAASPADQLWEVIHFLRDLGKPAESIARIKTAITLQLTEKDSVKRIIARAWQITANGAKIPLPDRKIVVGVKRMFGILPLNLSNGYTNDEGKVTALFTDDVPTDTAGQLIITAFIDDPSCEPGTIEETTTWGTTWEWTDMTKDRSLWARVRYAPIWLLISFTAVAGAIWLTILWVMLELKKVNDLGKKHQKTMAAS